MVSVSTLADMVADDDPHSARPAQPLKRGRPSRGSGAGPVADTCAETMNIRV